MRKDIYQEVTDQIIEQLESGTAPWLRPWSGAGKATAAMPHNAHSGRAYSGVNVLLLWSQSFSSNGWLTYKQAQALGGNVRKGSKGTRITYWGKALSKKTDEKAFMFLKTFTVFNLDQCDDIPVEKLYSAPETIEHDDTPAYTLAMANDARVLHEGSKACFIPSVDVIKMPSQDAFKGVNGYDATLLHELTHWSGHKSRLKRDLSGRFGNAAYAAEELIAEMGSAFLCAQLGVELKGLQHASYLESWLEVLRSDKRAIFTAASQARIATEFLMEALTVELEDAA